MRFFDFKCAIIYLAGTLAVGCVLWGFAMAAFWLFEHVGFPMSAIIFMAVYMFFAGGFSSWKRTG